MARAESASASAHSDSIKGLAQAVARPAYRRLLTAEPFLRRAVPVLIIAFLITLNSGFRILYRDSGGRVTDYEKAVAARTGSVDLILAATSASYTTNLIVDQALEYVRTYRPRAFMPAHHDAPFNNLWRPTEPIFQAIKDLDPTIVTISKGYREPTCFKTGTTVR